MDYDELAELTRKLAYWERKEKGYRIDITDATNLLAESTATRKTLEKQLVEMIMDDKKSGGLLSGE